MQIIEMDNKVQDYHKKMKKPEVIESEEPKKEKSNSIEFL